MSRSKSQGWILSTFAATCLAATLVATGAPAMAEEAPATAWENLPDLTLADVARPDLSLADEVRRDLPERRSPLVKLRLGAAPVGVAVEVSDGVHVGAAGDFDPDTGDGVALFALRLSL